MAMKWLARTLAAAAVWALSATGAQALTLQIVGGGLTATNLNYGCPTGSANCLTSADYSLAGAAAATGSLDITGSVMTISLYVPSVSFNGPGSPIAFTGMSYSGTATVSSVGGSIFQSGAGSGTVSGFVNGATPVSETPGIFNINCLTSGGSGQCGITFGRTGFTDVAGEDWVHTFNVNVTVVPEPATLLLLTLGAAGLALRARRA